MTPNATDRRCEACNGTGLVVAPTPYTKPAQPTAEKVRCETCGGSGWVPTKR